jgi:ABC-type Fe3+ transport system permease subunit
MFLAALPGLLGSLVVSLVTLYLFQQPVLGTLYDTPIPWLFALIVILLPRALLMHLILARNRVQSADHLARLLSNSFDPVQRQGGKALHWARQGQIQFWALALIAFWAYLDATSAALLAPVGWVSAPVRLYNLMHYGQSNVLSAMVVATLVLPLVGITLLSVLVRRWSDLAQSSDTTDIQGPLLGSSGNP